MIDPARAALLLIDMQMGFIDAASPLCAAGAAASVPACARALAAARGRGMRVVHVRRAYRADGSDVEPVRFEAWAVGGRPLSPGSDLPDSSEPPAQLAAAPGERVVVKPRFSAFFCTPLRQELSVAGVDTVVLAGTTTPNCIRATCYDALSLGFNVVVLQDATSSRTPEVQRANIDDMAHIGAHVMSVADFERRGLADVRDLAGEMRARFGASCAAAPDAAFRAAGSAAAPCAGGAL